MSQQPFMPISMLMPYMGYPQQQSRENDIPPRVRIALLYLNDITAKTMTRAAATEHQIQEIPGQELSKEEKLAQSNACALLSSYFAGSMELSELEKEEREDRKNPVHEAAGTVMNCFSCESVGRGPNPRCKICRGTGLILVTPMVESKDEPPPF